MNEKMISWLITIDENKIRKRSTIWNLISSMINATYSAILMFFIGRIIGMEEVGIFSIASAYAYQCLSIGAFGVRNVQASDVKIEYSFSDYLYLRVFSSIAMYGMLIYYTIVSSVTFEKMAIVFLFGVFKSFEAIEDLYHGEYHRYDRLDIGCILQATRYIISLILFIILIYISENLILSFLISTIFTGILCYLQNKNIIKYFVKEKLSFSFIKVKSLFLICLPICISNAINMYIVNCPKYTIEAVGNSIMQADYSILFLPVMIVNLLSAVIYRPVINTLSKKYYNSQYSDFFTLMVKQLFVILGLTLIIMLGGYLIGLKLLGIIYNVNLLKYMLPFMIMLFSGGINTIAVFLTIILTVQRAQNLLLVSYSIVGGIALFVAKPLVSAYGVLGAGLLYLFLSLCMAVIFGILIWYSYSKKKKFDVVNSF